MVDVIVAGAVRTPSGKFGGMLAELTAAELGASAVRETLRRTGIRPEQVDEIVMGNARQAGGGPNPARQIAYRAGLPVTVPAYTVNKACGSGMRAIINAAQSVALGDSGIVLAGGAESMSRVPYLLPRVRWGYRMGNQTLVDAMYQDGFHCPLCDLIMGETAENLVDRHTISREEQDQFALQSQQRATAAIREGRFQAEVAPLEIRSRKGEMTVLSLDEHPRPDSSLEKLGKLQPVFRPEGGSVSAGNSAGITDGAASMAVMTAGNAAKQRVQPMARVLGYATAGVDPAIMGIGPVPAIRKLLEKTALSIDKVDLVEINEAFAAQVIACERELGLDHTRVNVNGGAIALGHPVGCSGARIVVTLLHAMKQRKARFGIASACISGGMGIAMAFERLD
ncbi:MAG: acetyl-CoA C-acetyltransferase [Acidobacteriota bacterium]